MGWILTHKSDEIPILDSRCTVSKHISNLLGIYLGDSVETEGGLEELMSDISIKGSWNNHDVCVDVVFLEILCQFCSISKGMSSSY